MGNNSLEKAGRIVDARLDALDHRVTELEKTEPPNKDAPLWKDDFRGDWKNRWRLRYFGFDDWTEYFTKDDEGWARVEYRKGETGKGFRFGTRLEPQRDRVYLEYQFKFRSDFDWRKGGKLPGLDAGEGAFAGNKPDGTNGWSVRFMWREDGKGMAYVYHPEQLGKWGDNFRLSNFVFKRGVLHTLGLDVISNTPGKKDGRIFAWLDGILVVDESDIRFRDTDRLKIRGIIFQTFFGGSSSSWEPTKNEVIEFGGCKLYDKAP